MASFNQGHQSAAHIDIELDGEHDRLALPATGQPTRTRSGQPARAKLVSSWSSPPSPLVPVPSDGETFPVASRQNPLPWRGANLPGNPMSGALRDRPPRVAAALLGKCPRAQAVMAQTRLDRARLRGIGTATALSASESLT